MTRPVSLVCSFVNAEGGIESWVIRRTAPASGWSVILVDTDSGETCSAVLHFPAERLADAVSKALGISGLLSAPHHEIRAALADLVAAGIVRVTR